MIICAAIRLKIQGKKKEIVIPCLRHRDGWNILYELKPDITAEAIESAEEGFITNEGQFLSREGAFYHACLIGQLSINAAAAITNGILMSEDLY